MSNDSVAAFKARLARVPVHARAVAAAELVTQGQSLIESMRRANTDRTGALDASLRMQLSPLGTRLVVRGGGELTTKPVRRSAKGGAPQFDYALAYEFGRKGQPARPFFYPTYRLMKPRMRRAISAAIARGVKEAFGG